MQWSAAWSVSPVNNPHSHLKQKVGLIEPSSRAKNAKMFESCRYDFSRISPEVPTLHNPSSPWPPWWQWMALFGIALPKCTWHAATCAGQKSSRVQPSARKWRWNAMSTWQSRTFSSCWPMRVLWGMGPRQAFGKSLLDNPNHIPGFSFQTLGFERVFMSSF